MFKAPLQILLSHILCILVFLPLVSFWNLFATSNFISCYMRCISLLVVSNHFWNKELLWNKQTNMSFDSAQDSVSQTWLENCVCTNNVQKFRDLSDISVVATHLWMIWAFSSGLGVDEFIKLLILSSTVGKVTTPTAKLRTRNVPGTVLSALWRSSCLIFTAILIRYLLCQWGWQNSER